MNIFLKLLNKIRFENVELIGKVKDQFNEKTNKTKNFEYFKATPRKKDSSGFTLLLNGKVLQKDVEQLCAPFTVSDDLKPFTNDFKVATKTGRIVRLYDVNGYCISPLGLKINSTPSENYYDTTAFALDNSALQVDGFMGTSFFINFNNNFISEEYSSVEKLEDGTFKVVSKDTGKNYYLSKDLLPFEKPIAKIEEVEEIEDEMPENLEISVENKQSQVETMFGHNIMTFENGEKRFVDEKGKKRSYPIDKIVDIGNGTMLIKRNHSSNWDIQRTDNLKFVVKGLKNAIFNNDTNVTFAIYNDQPVIFGNDPLKMFNVDQSTAKLVMKLLNKSKMPTSLIDDVQAHPEELDKTLKTFKTVLTENLEDDPNSALLKRLTGISNKSLNRRFVNHLIGIYKAREKRENKNISDIEKRIRELESQISILNTKVEIAKNKKDIASESYSSAVENKSKLEKKLEEISQNKNTTIEENQKQPGDEE